MCKVLKEAVSFDTRMCDEVKDDGEIQPLCAYWCVRACVGWIHSYLVCCCCSYNLMVIVVKAEKEHDDDESVLRTRHTHTQHMLYTEAICGKL
mmetsp:Transcript_10670/g.15866  ORF Transcript_10670/g.15866 Transcript_10670/m.15866 type:complete len:93 (+) Transcript_10670:641-919(+)